MIKILITILLFISGYSFSQKIHIKYTFVRSEIATLDEDLYIDNNNVLSRQDSLIQFKNLNSNEGNIVAFKKGNGTRAFYFISKINNDDKRNFFFTSYVKDPLIDTYFIHDEVQKPRWIIDEKSIKKILGYECTKATANFRGTNITAYFTKKLPYSTGPFKFFGLPGLILDVRADNKSFDIWKAEKVEIDFKENINFTPKFQNYPKIEMKNFIEMKDQRLKKNRESDLKNLPSEIKVDYQMNRFGLEKVFEWEK